MQLPAVYPILDTASLARRSFDPAAFAEALLEGGARILQFRHKLHFSRAIFDHARRIAQACRTADVPFIVNDRADFALLLDAGVHLGQDDLPPADARRLLGPAPAIGFSTHNEHQLRAAAHEPADYLAFGPIFSTSTKDNPDPTVGLELLRTLRPLAQVPLVAIGGITRLTARAVWTAGADSVAVIGDLLPDELTRHSVRERMEEWQKLARLKAA